MPTVPSKETLELFRRDLAKIEGLELSNSIVDRISSGGDISGSPFYHFRWKKKCLADLVIWPKTVEHLSEILKLANKYLIPITPRGAGSCYYGSSSPTLGGAVLDMKRMRSIRIDSETKIVTVQAGSCFITLMEELDKRNLQIGCYPTSALTATIGGWIGTGGLVGVGTVLEGPFISQVIKMQIVTPRGEIQDLDERESYERYFGTNGILGIVAEIKLKVKEKIAVIPLVFGFTAIKNVLEIIKQIFRIKTPYFARFWDRQSESLCGGLQDYNSYLLLGIPTLNGGKDPAIEQIKTLIEATGGLYLGDSYSEKNWKEILIREMKGKKNVPVLMLQQCFIDLSLCDQILQFFEGISEKCFLNHCYDGIVGNDLKVRLSLYGPTDNADWNHFLSSKGVLHHTIKEVYKKGARVYAYGLQNTLYLKHFEQKKYKSLVQIKQETDPRNILNPFKITETKMSFARLDLLFSLTVFWRKLRVKLGLAKKRFFLETQSPSALRNNQIQEI